MKDHRLIVIGLAGLLGAGVLAWVGKGTNSSRGSNGGRCCALTVAVDAGLAAAGTNQNTPSAAVERTIAYYFHKTVRCDACLVIEAQARSVIEQQFGAEVAAGRLIFTPVNYELPENAHFASDYKLPCPSLVLVREQGGKEPRWQLLGDTWNLVTDPGKFSEYVKTEVGKFLADAKAR